MRVRNAPFQLTFWLAASCWFAAGPGGGMMRAALACRDADMQMSHQQMPRSVPCFCSQMAGGFDQVLSVATPAVAVVPIESEAIVELAPASRISRPASRLFPPETPPPIAA